LKNAANDRIAELERVLRADPGGSVLAALVLRALANPGRIGELCHQLETWADGVLGPAEPAPAAPRAEVSDVEFDRAFAAAEPELAQMITPDSIAEEAALFADQAIEERSPLASSGAFATRTMAELLEQQGDRRGAARIRAALGDPADGPPVHKDAALIAVLEHWLENARRLER
jgi:hypothetical protein